MLYQYLAELVTLLIASILLVSFLRRFSTIKQLYCLVLLPLMLFFMGFSMRLSGERDFIDLGYFFTDFSFLYVYLIFALSFLLGQVKYWKLKDGKSQ
ncbi:MAG TPA: hypothetical protein VJH04_04600 [archaeon]|nr:hypothetical protein [archaeon]